MKRFLIILTLFTGSLFFWFSQDGKVFDRKDFIPQKVLEYSMPFDVKIDIDLLNSLKPANE